jgi:hypothetical protein
MRTDTLGYLLYTADGRFSVTISRRGRARSAAGDLLGGTTEEQARVVGGFVAYPDGYSVYGDRVIHHVELSLFQLGRQQPRAVVEPAEDRLTLRASPLLLAGKQQVPHLVWERVDPFTGRQRWTTTAAKGLASVASTTAAESLNQPPDP